MIAGLALLAILAVSLLGAVILEGLSRVENLIREGEHDDDAC